MDLTRPILAAGAALIAGFVACSGSTPPPAPPEDAPPPPTSADGAAPEAQEAAAPEESTAAEQNPDELDIPPYGAPLDRIMQAHFNDALLIRKAVIEGRYEDAANPATVIANVQNLEELPEGWPEFVKQMQETATRITNSTTPAAAAAGAADLGVSCGLCHQKHGGPQPSTEPAPPPGTTVESRMKHHIWATERLWEGLAVPSDDAWDAGAQALSTDPFPADFLKTGGVDVRSAASDFTKLAGKAPKKKTPQERAGLYAELLITCGTCHHSVKNKD